MKIALVTVSFLPQIGGAEFTIHHLANEWSKLGHEVCVVNTVSNEATSCDAKYMIMQYKLLRGSTKFGYHRFPFKWYGTRALGKALRQFEPDFISAHFGYPTGLWLSQLKPVPRYLLTCHGRELWKSEWGYRSVYKIDNLLAEALNKSAGAVAISSQAKELMQEMGVESSKIVCIPNGVDIDRFQTKVAVDFRKRLDIPRDAIVILSVGQEHPQKGYDTGLRAFAKVAVRFSRAHYVILGKGVEKWQGLAKELGIGERMRLCAGLYGDELVGAYQQSDIFFSPSWYELCPLVVLEAMAAGCAEVVTDVGGSQDLIETGENGIVVAPGDIEKMAEALGRLVENESLRKRFGQANLEKSRLYSWDRIGKMYLEHT